MTTPNRSALPVRTEVSTPLPLDSEREHGGIRASFILFNLLPSTLVSFVMHMLLVVVLAFMVIQLPNTSRANMLIVSNDNDIAELEDFDEEIAQPIDPAANIITEEDQHTFSTSISTEPTPIEAAPGIEWDAESPTEPISADIPLADFGIEAGPKKYLTQSIGANSLTGVGSRKPTAGSFHPTTGCTTTSERAVALALKWLTEHQNPDGSWNFDHTRGACNRRCSHEGKLTECTTGATALALLPLLGAGQTHKEGKYKTQVERGLYYLANRMKVHNNLGDLSEGTMYAHGIASIALCEAYAMTHDKSLIAPAQLSLNYVMHAQDPIGGGWRYAPKQPGDTSAVGWQLMALKSGHIAYLKVDGTTIQGVSRFLDSVQGDGGATYGYTSPGNGPATSAVGLLSRMYLGWKQDNPALQRGIDALGKRGPVKGQFYYNYYATQVLRHHGGERWEKWNEVMRDSLVASQATQDHMAGSWHETGDHGAEAGGRLYCTSLATMILEVYYRHLPLYKNNAIETDFVP